MDNEPINYRFKVVREDLGLSLRWLARESGVPRKKLQLMEDGVIPFTPQLKVKLSLLMHNYVWLEE